jgi:phosphoglycolate phosphatase
MNALAVSPAMPPRAARGCAHAPTTDVASSAYDVVSFDLDGTLVDTADEIAVAANRALEAHGMTPRTLAEITGLIGDGSRQLMLKLLARILLERPGLADTVRPDAVLQTFDEQLSIASGRVDAAYAGARDALQRLRDGGVRLACVTNKELHHAHRVLQAAQLDDLFELVVGGDSLPQKKPHPSVLRHVVETLHCDTRRAAHVGDSATDVEAARNAGVAAWAVPYGYNAGVPIAEAGPERVFAALSEVVEHVLRGRTHNPSRVPTSCLPEQPFK